MITPERLNEMESLFWAESIDPETEEWRNDLNAEEAALVADWDDQVNQGISQLIEDIQSYLRDHK